MLSENEKCCQNVTPPMRGPPPHRGLAFTAPATDQENELLTTFTTDTENESSICVVLIPQSMFFLVLYVFSILTSNTNVCIMAYIKRYTSLCNTSLCTINNYYT